MKSETNIQTEQPKNQNDNFCRFDAVVGLTPYYQDETTIIYNCDSLTALAALRPSHEEIIIVTDPPYGIGANKMTLGNGKRKIYRGENDWDNERPHRVYFELMKYVSRHQIIFGGNYFNDYLGDTRSIIIWDKGTGDNDFADGELAWTNYDKVLKIYKKSWVGANAKDDFSKREHPTQKPLELMFEILEDYTTPADIIVDPFMGSGTTLVAAKQLGRKAIGIEKELRWCEIAVKRLQNLQTKLVM